MRRKPGRNDPCTCGSGKKYKKCCLERHEAERALARKASALDGDDDWGGDEDECARETPFNLSEVLGVRYDRGVFETAREFDSGKGLQATEWLAPDIPREILESLTAEALVELEGSWGDPGAGVPIQADIIELYSADDEVIVEVYNRAITLAYGNDHRVKRIHRVCGVLEAAAKRGTGLTLLPPSRTEPGDFDMHALSLEHLDTPGSCLLCGAAVTYDKTAGHLAQCAPEHDAASGALGVILLLRVTAPDLPGYWMDVEILQDAPLAALDKLLRATWLECCGHLSQFRFANVEYHSNKESLDEWGPGPTARRTMAVSLKKAVEGESGFDYEYDFGSTTELAIDVLTHRSGRLGRRRARVVTRNAEPTWPCGVCGQPATVVCSVCRDDTTNPFACDGHAGRHGCGEAEAFLPVVNSPRLGVCAYGLDLTGDQSPLT